MATKELAVYMDGVLAGQTLQTIGGDLTFEYDDGYRTSPGATPLSLSLPLHTKKHRGASLRNYLWGLLPDSGPTLDRWAAEYQVSANNPAALLAHVGRDAAGAIQVLPLDQQASDAAGRHGDVQELTHQEFLDACREVAEHRYDWDPGPYGGRWSLAGAQPKLAFFRDNESSAWARPMDSTPTTHIIKPVPVDSPYRAHHVNEFLCQRAAALAGLRAANIEILAENQQRIVVSERYDRVRGADGSWRRVHQEDLCQALAIHPSLKYQDGGKGPTLAKIADLIRRLPLADRAATAEDFLMGLAFNTFIGGTDAHAKNYGLLLRADRVRLAPLYDLASAACYDQHQRLANAIKISGKKHMLDVTQADWEKVATSLGLRTRVVGEFVNPLRERLPTALSDAAGELPASLQDQAAPMVHRIIEHIEGRWRPNLDADPRYKLRR